MKQGGGCFCGASLNAVVALMHAEPRISSCACAARLVLQASTTYSASARCAYESVPRSMGSRCRVGEKNGGGEKTVVVTKNALFLQHSTNQAQNSVTFTFLRNSHNSAFPKPPHTRPATFTEHQFPRVPCNSLSTSPPTPCHPAPLATYRSLAPVSTTQPLHYPPQPSRNLPSRSHTWKIFVINKIILFIHRIRL